MVLTAALARLPRKMLGNAHVDVGPFWAGTSPMTLTQQCIFLAVEIRVQQQTSIILEQHLPRFTASADAVAKVQQKGS